MLGPWRPLLLLLLLPLHCAGDAEDPGGAGVLRDQLRAAAALCRRYWALLGCQVGSRPCDEDQTQGWSLPLLGQQYLDILSTWYCRFGDCCDTGDCRISNDLSGLESDLQGQVHGQPLARDLVLRSVKSFLELDQPDKALGLSFHGGSGTGKNFVARIMADNLFRDGLRSDCVQMFIATLHFPHPKYVDQYQERLTDQIQKTQDRCPQTLFIFDEAEKLHPDLLEVLQPQLKRRVPETQRTKPWRTFYLFLRVSLELVAYIIHSSSHSSFDRTENFERHLQYLFQHSSSFNPDLCAPMPSSFLCKNVIFF
ncbi:torsin-3A isoform X2 [Erinaceus europaeus]|uniref:Torsin-3A isoform X2 n=1 Tax=Erinaceus europaeus TaxID=9365 RepID=A0ABM3XY45_ERIEU|nr:torsin-3A isoform X2 [Erinaceus europaeus]